MRTVAVILPIVAFFASGPGAGIAASIAFDALRRRFPLPAMLSRSPLVRAAYAALHAPRFARVSALVLAATISVPCAMLLALVSGDDALNALDLALAAAISAIVSQLRHALTLPVAPVEETQ